MAIAQSDPTDALRRKLGTAAASLLPAERLAAAEAALEAAAASVRPYVLQELAALHALAKQRSPGSAAEIFEKAHMIRGLAGTCGLKALGSAASSMCLYLDEFPSDQALDMELLTSISVAMIHAAKAADPPDPLLSELIAACRAAAQKARPDKAAETF